MPAHRELLYVMLALTAVLGWGNYEYSEVRESEDVEIASFERIRSIDFDRACTDEGVFAVGGPDDCFQKGKYRFWRRGMTTSIGIVDGSLSPSLVFQSGGGRPLHYTAWSLDWKEILAALSDGKGGR